MQGEPRPGCKIVPFTVNVELLRQFDALVGHGQRSREMERMMKAKVLRHKLGEQLAEEHLRDVLALID